MTNKKFYNFINNRTDSGDSALHVAVKQGYFEELKILIQHNADINAVNSTKQTPLHLAAMCGGAETVSLLLSKQPHVNCQDEDLKTPLH